MARIHLIDDLDAGALPELPLARQVKRLIGRAHEICQGAPVRRVLEGGVLDGRLHGFDGLVAHFRCPARGVGRGEAVEHLRDGVGDREETGGFLPRAVSMRGRHGAPTDFFDHEVVRIVGGGDGGHTSSSTHGRRSSPTPIRSSVVIPLGTQAAATYTSASTPPFCPRAARSLLLSPRTDAPP